MDSRTFSTLLLLLAVPFAATAQRAARSGLGYMGGPQLCTWRSELVIYRPMPGVVAGLYAPVWVGNHFEIQPELLLSLGGTSHDVADGGRATLRSLHAVMPVSLKYFPGRTFNLQAGVQGGYLLMAQADGTDASHLLNVLDMGVTIGAGLGFPSGVDLTLRYYEGLSNTLREDHALFPDNHTLQLTVGKRFTQFRHSRLSRH